MQQNTNGTKSKKMQKYNTQQKYKSTKYKLPKYKYDKIQMQ